MSSAIALQRSNLWNVRSKPDRNSEVGNRVEFYNRLILVADPP